MELDKRIRPLKRRSWMNKPRVRLIFDVTDELHYAIRLVSAQKNMSMRVFITDAIEEKIEKETNKSL